MSCDTDGEGLSASLNADELMACLPEVCMNHSADAAVCSHPDLNKDKLFDAIAGNNALVLTIHEFTAFVENIGDFPWSDVIDEEIVPVEEDW